jgi:O-antigen ligase
MKPEHALAMILVPLATLAAAAAASCFRRVRDLFFLLIVGGSVLVERLDVNFFSEAWYRGTTRGVQISIIEILAAGLLVGCWLGRREGEDRRRWFWPGSLGLILAFFAYACVAVVAADHRLYGLFELSRMFAALLVFLAAAAYVRSRREWTLFVAALAAAVAFESAWAIKQHFVTHLDRAVASLTHANSLSMYLCLTVPPLVAFACAGWSRWLRAACGFAAVLGTVGILLTLSRAGIPIFAAVVVGTILTCISWRLSFGFFAVRFVIVFGLVAVVAAFWPQLEQRYAGMSLEEEYLDPTVDGRGIYLRLGQMIAREHFFGVGLNNWSYYVSLTYGPRLGFRFTNYPYLESVYGTADDKLFGDSYLAAPAHNLAALTLGELGIPGLILFTLLWLRWFGMSAAFLPLPRELPMRTIGVGIFFGTLGIFGQSLTEWVYRQTPILFTFYAMLGTLASVAAARREEKAAARQQVAEAEPLLEAEELVMEQV